MFKWVRIGLVSLAALLVLSIVAGGATFAYYAASDRIYPGISVGEIDLSGLTVEQATAVLTQRLPDPASRQIELRAEGHTWRISWADVGKAYDCAGTSAAAHQVARTGTWLERASTALRVRTKGHSIAPLVVPADPARVTAILQRSAPLISVPPTEAQLRIDPTGLTSVSGQPGRELDVEASTARVLQALAADADAVELVMADVPPRLAQPEPALTLARSLLARPFVLMANDPLTDYQARFEADPAQVATWLRAVPEVRPDSARMTLEVDETTVQQWLAGIAPQLGSERLLNVPETLTRTVAALVAGQAEARARIDHPPGSYVVQPGDTLYDIAYRHGFTQWRLEEANPDVDPDALLIGMELTIPSIDVLFPEPLVPGKRIEISLSEQRLRAYEDEALVYDFTCSTGISNTPTVAGQFQVLFKEPEAYAQRWSLDMPYFMAVYQERPGFFNGIHELPITADGRRLWSGVLGWPASYGCIILDVGDAERLYDWAPVGTLVRITGYGPDMPVYGEGAQPAEEPAEQPPEEP